MSRALRDYNAIDWHSLFYYEPSSKTGLKWKVNRYAGKNNGITCALAGEDAGSIHIDHSKGTEYALVCSSRKNWFAHRVIWIMHNGYLDPEYVIDHIDGNSLNNSIENLRVVKQKLNNRNASARKDNNTGISGVHFTTAKNKDNPKGYTYATATWYYDYGDRTQRYCKHFSVVKYGLLPAFAMACKYREQKIAELNANGAGYTDLHGKIIKHENSL